jgi:hypothetical protein
MAEEVKRPSSPPEGLGWRVSLSILVSIGWIIFLIYWFFFVEGFTMYEKVAIVLLSLLVLGGILGIPWYVWGKRFMSEEDKSHYALPGFRWRVWASPIIVLGLIGFFIYWLFTQARNYTVFQNIGVFIIVILLMGGILGAMWAPWGIKYGKK